VGETTHRFTDFPRHSRETASKSVNDPFHEWRMQGKAVMTILGGRITHQEPARGK